MSGSSSAGGSSRQHVNQQQQQQRHPHQHSSSNNNNSVMDLTKLLANLQLPHMPTQPLSHVPPALLPHSNLNSSNISSNSSTHSTKSLKSNKETSQQQQQTVAAATSLSQSQNFIHHHLNDPTSTPLPSLRILVVADIDLPSASALAEYTLQQKNQVFDATDIDLCIACGSFVSDFDLQSHGYLAGKQQHQHRQHRYQQAAAQAAAAATQVAAAQQQHQHQQLHALSSPSAAAAQRKRIRSQAAAAARQSHQLNNSNHHNNNMFHQQHHLYNNHNTLNNGINATISEAAEVKEAASANLYHHTAAATAAASPTSSPPPPSSLFSNPTIAAAARTPEETAALEGLMTATLSQLESIVCRVVYCPGATDPVTTTVVQTSAADSAPAGIAPSAATAATTTTTTTTTATTTTTTTTTTRTIIRPKRLTPNSRNIHQQWLPVAPGIGCAALLYLDPPSAAASLIQSPASSSSSSTNLPNTTPVNKRNAASTPRNTTTTNNSNSSNNRHYPFMGYNGNNSRTNSIESINNSSTYTNENVGWGLSYQALDELETADNYVFRRNDSYGADNDGDGVDSKQNTTAATTNDDNDDDDEKNRSEVETGKSDYGATLDRLLKLAPPVPPSCPIPFPSSAKIHRAKATTKTPAVMKTSSPLRDDHDNYKNNKTDAEMNKKSSSLPCIAMLHQQSILVTHYVDCRAHHPGCFLNNNSTSASSAAAATPNNDQFAEDAETTTGHSFSLKQHEYDQQPPPWPVEHSTFLQSQTAQHLLCLEIASGTGIRGGGPPFLSSSSSASSSSLPPSPIGQSGGPVRTSNTNNSNKNSNNNDGENAAEVASFSNPNPNISTPSLYPPEWIRCGKSHILLPGSLRQRGDFSIVEVALQPEEVETATNPSSSFSSFLGPTPEVTATGQSASSSSSFTSHHATRKSTGLGDYIGSKSSSNRGGAASCCEYDEVMSRSTRGTKSTSGGSRKKKKRLPPPPPPPLPPPGSLQFAWRVQKVDFYQVNRFPRQP